jgi:hypothetical protein
VRSSGRLLLGALLLLGSGCASIPWPFFRPDGLERGFTAEDLGTDLAAYATRFGAVVGSTADDIHDQTSSRVVRKRALIWRLQMPPLVEEVAYGTTPQSSYIATVLVAVAQQRYLTEGDGRDLFGEQQKLAIDAANQLVEDVLAIGDRFLTQKQVAEVAERTREFADKYPIQGRDFSVQRIPRAVAANEARQSLAWLVSLPLAPFSALKGVDSGADAIRDFNRTAQQFTEVVKRLPERIRGQLELFTYDLEDRETVERSVDALDRAASSAERAAATFDRLPDELRHTFDESQARIEAVGKVVAQAQAVAQPLADTATQLEQASAHWLAVLGPKDPTPKPGERPFDVRDWQAAAQSIGSAAGELRGLADDLHTLQGTNALDAAVDRAFWRGVVLIGLLFVALFAALVGSRAVAARLGRG